MLGKQRQLKRQHQVKEEEKTANDGAEAFVAGAGRRSWCLSVEADPSGPRGCKRS